MEEVKLQMDNYVKKLENEYFRANSVSKKKKIAFDLINFSIFYNKIFSGKNLPWSKDESVLRDYYSCNSIIVKEFLKNIEKDRKIYNILSQAVIDSFSQVKYPFYKNNYKIVDLPRLTNKESNEIMLSFLKSFGLEYYSKLIEMSKNNELLGIPSLNYGEGETTSINTLKKNFIILSDELGNNVFTTGVALHEFGHAYEFYISNATLSQSLNTPFYEVSSCFFEYAFFRYLKENKIYTHSADICLDILYKNMLSYCAEMNLINDISADSEIDEYEFDVDKVEKMKEDLNYYNLQVSDDIIYTDPYIYGTGYLFAIFLYDSYKQDKEKFNYNFKNMLTSYPFAGNIETFKNFNITEESLKEGKILRKTLNNFKDDFLIK